MVLKGVPYFTQKDEEGPSNIEYHGKLHFLNKHHFSVLSFQ